MTEHAKITLGDEDYRVERVSGRKASAAFALLREVGDAVPEVVNRWGEFTTEYERSHVMELDRVQARMRYPRQPIIGPDGEVMRDKDGEVITAPSSIDAMTETDWQQAGGVLRIPETPSVGQQIAAVFPMAVTRAEDNVYRLLALFTLTNAEVKKAWRENGHQCVRELVEERKDELLDDVLVDDLLELAVVVGETIDGQLRAKVDQLGDRLGNALRVLGLGQDPTTSATQPASPTDSTPSSSTDTHASTAPASTGSSTPPTPSSPSSGGSPTPSTPNEKPQSTEPASTGAAPASSPSTTAPATKPGKA